MNYLPTINETMCQINVMDLSLMCTVTFSYYSLMTV